MDDFNNKVIKGFAWEASTRFVVQIASWVSTIWVARLLTPEDYGLVAISGIFSGLCLTISGLGLGSALVNKTELFAQDMANVFWTNVVLAAVIYSALFFAAPYIAQYYETPELTDIIRVGGLMVIISPLSVVPRAMTMRQLKFKAVAIIAMVANLIVIAVTLSLAYSGWGYWSLVISTVSAEVFNLIAYMIVARYLPTRPHDIRSVLPMYKYGVSLLSSRLIAYFNSNSPIMVAAQFVGNIGTGHFQMANTLAKMPMKKIGQVFSKIAFPAFSRIKDDKQRSKITFLTMHRYLFMIVAPMFIGIALIAKELIPVALGTQWQAIIQPLQILCVINVLSGSAIIIPRALEGQGNAKASLKYQTIVALTAPACMLFGIQWGLVGMVVGWAVSIPIGYVYLIRVLLNSLDMKMSEFFDSISTTLLCVLVMSVAVLCVDYVAPQFQLDQIATLLIKLTLAVSCYFIGYLIWGKKEVGELQALIRSRRYEG